MVGASLMRGGIKYRLILPRIFLKSSGLDNQFDLRSSFLRLHADGVGAVGTEVFILIAFR